MSYTDEQYEQAKSILLEHRGKGNEISSRELNDELGLDNVGSFPQTRALIRDIMQEERIPVIGGGNGYYVAETEEELAGGLSTLESRIMSTTERKMLLQRAAAAWEDEIVPSDAHDVF